jgi:serine/threonine protein kinase/tetratricopeptide (TPR) repeat protein
VLPIDDRRTIDEVCDRFEVAWRSEGHPELALFLNEVPEHSRRRLFRELLALDVDYRTARGESPDPAAYLAEFPEFVDLVDAAFTLRGGDGPTRRARRGQDGSTTDLDFHWEQSGDRDVIERALRTAGYEVIEQIGRGGMGVVFRAHELSLNRPVAVKVVRSAEFATSEERRRFQNEAEAVASLDHPHIVPIYEVGESGGLNYFSMKLIQGASLERQLEGFQNKPRTSARLVAELANAVQHAHERGILHRDLKPANILLDERDEPHVTDFGLARRLDHDFDLTHSGAIVGTPSYMSPEQATGARGSLTIAADIYGLGSILYALLTGRGPHTGNSLAEILFRVRDERPEPPTRLNPKVPRDLEVICLKCLEKEPKRRYASAQALADDLARWLAGEPIAARPVSWATRVWMFCRRHPALASLAAMLVFAIAAGLGGVAWQWRKTDRERSVNARLTDFWTRKVLLGASTAVHPHAANKTVRDLLDLAANGIRSGFDDSPEAEAAIQETVGEAYASLGEIGRARSHLEAALALYSRVDGPDSPKALRVANLVSSAIERAGRHAEAETQMRRNLKTSTRSLGRYHPTTLAAAHQLGVLLRKRGKLGEAEPLLRQTLDARRQTLIPDHPDTLRTIKELGLVLEDLCKLAEAESLANEFEHGIRCARGPNHPDNVIALANLGLLRRYQRRLDEAEAFYRKAANEAARILGPEHPSTLDATTELALFLLERGRAQESQSILRRVVEVQAAALGPEHPTVKESRSHLRRAAAETVGPNRSAAPAR